MSSPAAGGGTSAAISLISSSGATGIEGPTGSPVGPTGSPVVPPVGPTGPPVAVGATGPQVGPPFSKSSSARLGPGEPHFGFNTSEYSVTTKDLKFQNNNFISGSIIIDGIEFTVSPNGSLEKKTQQKSSFFSGGENKTKRKLRTPTDDFAHLIDKLMKK